MGVVENHQYGTPLGRLGHDVSHRGVDLVAPDLGRKRGRRGREHPGRRTGIQRGDDLDERLAGIRRRLDPPAVHDGDAGVVRESGHRRRQPRLSHTRFAAENHDLQSRFHRRQRGRQRGELGVTTHERSAGCARQARCPSRPASERPRRVGRRPVELALLEKDGVLEGHERCARLDAELVGEKAADSLEGAQCFGLTPGAIQREQELRPERLAERKLGHGRLG